MVPKGEHHAIGKAESAVSELDKVTRATIHDANMPFNVWDFVVDHMALLDSMTTYASSSSAFYWHSKDKIVALHTAP